MNVQGKHYRTIWLDENNLRQLQIIDQRSLPHRFLIETLHSVDDVIRAIADMHVRGAGLIGAAGGFGVYLACLEAQRKSPDLFIESVILDASRLVASRPTAVNLQWAVNRVLDSLQKITGSHEAFIRIALDTALAIADEDAEFCRRIGQHGKKLIEDMSLKKNGQTVNVLTHCNAGWLAFVDFGTATAPIYAAFEQGIDIHVWVDETRPRNQGASLTAWELGQHGVPYTVVTDNAGGHLMQHGMVDMVITGTDRTTYTGDVANKIGTYLKALAAKDNDIPFYVALPSSTFDWTIRDGIREIPIEQRDGDEVRYMQGLHEGQIKTILLTPKDCRAANYAFDVTPARLISALITERGICTASAEGIFSLFPEKRRQTF